MEPEGSLPHSQASVTRPYPGPAQSSPYTHILEIRPNIIHPSMPRSPQWSPSLPFPHQDPIHPPLLTHTRQMTSPSHKQIKYVFWFSLQFFSETFLILSTIQRHTITYVYRSSRKLLLFLPDFNAKYFSTDFKNPFSGSGVDPRERTDTTELIVAFRNFANAPKTELCDDSMI